MKIKITKMPNNKRAFGGWNNTHGGDFSNGVIQINSGGLHSTNPYEGVQIGVDNQGIPNLVEEGEVIWNDYVFSNRLKVPKQMKSKYKLRGQTFADIAKNAQKESEERPNDPISKRGLEDIMSKLAMEQEILRDNKVNKKYAKGGKLYSGLEDNPTQEMTMLKPKSYVGDIESIHLPTINISSVNKKDPNTWLRYAPAIGSGIAAMSDLFRDTDYGNADLIRQAADNLSTVKFTPINDYLTYRPLDRNYGINILNAQANSTRRAIENQANGNRGAAMAGILAADYNAQTQLGNLYRAAEEYNQAQKERVATFNRGTHQYNSEGAMRADMANMERDRLRLQAAMSEAQMREQIDSMDSASRSANLSNFYNNLGNIGTENAYMQMIENSPYLLYGTYGKYKGGNSSKNGGYLTIKSKKRRR